MKEDVFFANKEVISRETVQMVVGLVEAGIEREGLLADTTIEEVVVLGVQVKIQEVQTGEEVTEEEKQMEVDHRIVKVMEDTEGQEYEDKIETTDEEDQEVEAVISVTRIIQRKEDVADLRKKDQNLEKIIMKIEFQGDQDKKKVVVSMKQAVGKEVHQQSIKSNKKMRRDQKTENE